MTWRLSKAQQRACVAQQTPAMPEYCTEDEVEHALAAFFERLTRYIAELEQEHGWPLSAQQRQAWSTNVLCYLSASAPSEALRQQIVAMYEHLSALVCERNDAAAWHLDAHQQHAYVANLLACMLVGDDTVLKQQIVFYHQAHVWVQMLGDETHPEHFAAWEAVAEEIRAILRHKNLVEMARKRDAALEEDDLIQVARRSVYAALPTYRYASKFSTWLFSTTFNSVRSFLRPIRSLTTDHDSSAVPGENQEPYSETDNPEDIVSGHLLFEQVQQILQAHVDGQAQHIFWLRVQRYSLREIGKIMHVTPWFVRKTLAQIRAVIVSEYPNIHL
jgi:RNA polymerase sigma factor (sigma-70 family)